MKQAEQKAVTDSRDAAGIIDGIYNITRSIVRGANARKHLTAIATGGSCDFIARELGGGATLVLSSAIDGSSPDRLNEKSLVALYLDESWRHYVSFTFDTAVEAMDFMSGFNGVEIELGPLKDV